MGHHRKLCSILFNKFLPAVFLSEAGLYCGSAQRELGCDWLICLTTPFCPLKTWSISIQHSDRSRTFNFLNEVRMVLLPGPISEERCLCSEASELIPLPRTILSYPAGIRHTAVSDYVFGMPTSQPGVYEHRGHQDRSECCQRCCYCLMCKQNRVSSPELQERLLRTSEISHRR